MTSVKKTELSIVILSYNVRELLSDCLKSLFDDPLSKNWQIIVVDNFSSDDSVEFLQKNYRNKIKIIESDSNLGFAAGNNLAIPFIKAKHVLFLNPDTVVEKGSIGYVYDYLVNHTDVGAATCKIVLPNGEFDEACHRGFPTPWNSFCHFSGLARIFKDSKLFSGYSHGHKSFDISHEIDALEGAFMMLPTSVGKKVGWWDEDYFFNADDLDFCYRIKQFGYKIMYLPEVKIIHYKGASAGYKPSSHGKNVVTKETKLRTAKSSTQAMKLFYEKHYMKKYPGIVTWFTLTGIKLLELYRLRRIK